MNDMSSATGRRVFLVTRCDGEYREVLAALVDDPEGAEKLAAAYREHERCDAIEVEAFADGAGLDVAQSRYLVTILDPAGVEKDSHSYTGDPRLGSSPAESVVRETRINGSTRSWTITTRGDAADTALADAHARAVAGAKSALAEDASPNDSKE